MLAVSNPVRFEVKCSHPRSSHPNPPPGHCFHLVTRPKMASLPPFATPEMQRTQLDDLCLQIVLLGLGSIEYDSHSLIRSSSSTDLSSSEPTRDLQNQIELIC